MFVEDCMTANPLTVFENESVSRADELLRKHQMHQLIVVDDSKRLSGIITTRDTGAAIGYAAARGEKLQVSEIMTAEPKTIDLDATLDDALRSFCSTHFNAFPVVETTRLVGIITRHDLLRAFHKILGLDRKGIRVEIALPSIRDNLSDAFSALHSYEGDVISAVVSSMRRDGDEPTLYLRVVGPSARPVEECLRRCGLIVLQPEHE